ncbi:structure-specific recognition protein-domain-containing protein [Piptocephalis cylindrospora]|uniref:FACT complex subunit POB3 n=1 Tax=Piptocephalis cylindrospora TaxID=1907219 RepID=A0A4V1IY25_9FUNG|nr:structure-specific recognition protein-domain-containing protein [Piptocephalis cylindrospora]|eukprot:RKP13079.1 structure-specific recognition protein-domain-containing protein [Piptocephalis cylindrospora]
MSDRIEEFSNILRYPHLEKGKLRMAESGLGFKPAASPNQPQPTVFTLRTENLRVCLWQRASIGFRLRLGLGDRTIVLFDGFRREDFDRVQAAMKRFYRLTLEAREPSVRGWNWGEVEVQSDSVAMSIHKRPVFDLPLSKLASSQITGRNEISLEFTPVHTDSHFMGDELIETRLYMTGSSGLRPSQLEGAKDKPESADDEEGEVSKVEAFNEDVKRKADLGQAMGDVLLSFPETLFLTPRGRYDVDVFSAFIRLRGKTYDYKLPYTGIHRIFEAHKPDDLHVYLTVGVEPAVRQGQTRYPYLVLQFAKDELSDVQMNLEKYVLDPPGRDGLSKVPFPAPFHLPFSPSPSPLYPSPLPTSSYSVDHHDGLKSSHKANEGFLFPMESHLVFLPKPPIILSHKEVGNVVFMRADSALTSSARTFDLKINLRNGNEHIFSNISKEEHPPLVAYMRNRGIKVVKDLSESADVRGTVNYAESSEEDVMGVPMGGDEEEDEEEDEDFVPGKAGDSDVGEEYDENFQESEDEDAME